MSKKRIKVVMQGCLDYLECHHSDSSFSGGGGVHLSPVMISLMHNISIKVQYKYM